MCKGNCYSPKIKEDLIPCLYKLRKYFRIPMTRLVNEWIEKMIEGQREDGTFAIIEFKEKEDARQMARLDDLSRKFNTLIKKGKYDQARDLISHFEGGNSLEAHAIGKKPALPKAHGSYGGANRR